MGARAPLVVRALLTGRASVWEEELEAEWFGEDAAVVGSAGRGQRPADSGDRDNGLTNTHISARA